MFAFVYGRLRRISRVALEAELDNEIMLTYQHSLLGKGSYEFRWSCDK
jgi:hypothetical protein